MSRWFFGFGLMACSGGEAIQPPPVDSGTDPSGSCGVVWEGELSEIGVRLQSQAILREAEGGFAEFTLQTPGPRIDRLELSATGSVALFVRRPGADVPNAGTPLDDQRPFVRLDAGVSSEVVTVDPRSQLTLDDFRSSGIEQMQWVVAATEPGPFRVETVCTEGPLFQSTFLGSFPQGEPMSASPVVLGHDDAQFTAAGPLPPGLELAGGVVSGTPTEV
ncbi:MAG: hypothetical protein AAF211_34255, partial [Myxococcota bacterium]